MQLGSMHFFQIKVFRNKRNMSYPQLAPAQNQSIQVCSISLNERDRIRLIGLPLEVINEMRSTITKCWGPVQNEKDYYGTYEFKLKGYPWHGQGEDAVYSRRLLAGVLTTMAQFGWNLIQAADVSKKQYDKDTMFFEKGIEDPDAHLFAMSFNEHDKIRLIDAPTLLPCVVDAVHSQWPPGIQKERDYYGAKELKLSGTPWYPDGSECVYGRMLLCQIIANVRATGYKLYASVDISVGVDGMDLETWVFRRVGDAWQ